MRNLTKVLALVLALTMMVSVAGFAASFTDVASDANYAEAVSVLSDLGLVAGMGDGTFGAEQTLTRAQAATFVVRLMGQEDAAISAQGSDTGFTDVPADHWATGYISIAANRGVVAGMGDGTFEPDAELEYAQIVKMIVVALGYEPQAAELGEWPNNYISTASSIGLTKGIPGKATEKVTRATTARLLYAALTIPKMAKNGVGVNATFQPSDTLILDDLGIYKLIGQISEVVAAEDKVTLSATGLKQGLALDKKYKEIAYDDEDATYDLGLDLEAAGAAVAYKGMESVPAYIYVSEVDGEPTILSAVAKKNVSTVTFTSEDYDELKNTNRLYYYTNAEQTKTSYVKLAGSIAVRENNAADDSMTPAEFVAHITSDAYSIELINTDSDDLYDQANLTKVQYMVVGEVDVDRNGVYTITPEDDFDLDGFGMDEFEIDTENDETAITIVKGEEVIDVEDIAEGDILNIVVYAMDDEELVEASIYVTNDTVEGVVKYVDSDDELIVLEDGTEFGYFPGCDYGLASNTEATFYLGASGKLVYVGDETAVSSYKYGFATNVEFAAKRGALKTGTLRILTTEGEWATLDLKATVKVNGTPTKITGVDTDDEMTAFANTFAVAAGNVYNSDEELIVSYNNVIAYKLDASGLVKEIVNVTDGEENPGWNELGENKKFSEDAEDGSAFGGYLVDETTVVFNLVENYTPEVVYNFEETKVSVADISIFEDAETYTGVDFININDKTDLVSVIKGSFEAAIDFEANYFVVSKILDRTIEDETVTQIEGFQNGEKVVYYYSADREPDVKKATFGTEIALGDVDYSAFAAGDILILNADSNGFITTGAYITKVGEFATAVAYTADKFDDYADVAVDGEDEGKLFVGFVAKEAARANRFFVTQTIIATDTYGNTGVEVGEEVNFKGAVVTTYDFTETKVANRVSDGKVVEGSVVFGRMDEDGKVKEVVVIINDTTKDYDAK